MAGSQKRLTPAVVMVEDLEQVTRGMELLSWRYDPTDWNAHLGRQKQHRERHSFSARLRRWAARLRNAVGRWWQTTGGRLWRAATRSKGRILFPVLVALVALGVISIKRDSDILLDLFMAVVFVILVIGGLALLLACSMGVFFLLGKVSDTLLWLCDRLYDHRRNRLHPRPADEVSFTSTGFTFGSQAFAWHSLKRAKLVPAGVHTPAYLELQFRRRRLELPVPLGLEQDVKELCQLLTQKIAGRSP